MKTTASSRPVAGINVVTLVLLLAWLLTGCGSGGDSAAPTWTPSDRLWIASPTSSDSYQTDRAELAMSGSAFVPAGASCPLIIGVMPPGYSVTWSNSANGASGSASFELYCLLLVHVGWHADGIPLAIGTNAITVTATDAEGHVGYDTLVVTRVPDVTPPTVASVSPTAGAVNVDINANVVVTFSEAMDPASIDAASITLRDDANNLVPAAVSYQSYAPIATLSPTAPLAYGSTYQATVTPAVTDAAGNALAAPYVWSFTTGASPDVTPPALVSVSPAPGSYCAAPGGVVAASFDEDLDPATVSGATFTLTGPGSQAVPGTVSYLDRTVSFVPVAALPLATPFTASLTTGLADLAGNPLAAPYAWSFTTVASEAGSWAPTSLSGAPFARYLHAAVWTGSEMIVAGGLAWDADWDRFDYTSQYGRYNPASGTWAVAMGAPPGGSRTAVWTGSRMLVWGGYQAGSALSGGGAYDPAVDAWAVLATAGQPAARYGHTAVWSGSEMIVWGGQNGVSIFGTGARYNPATDSWQPVSTAGAPTARHGHTAVWTGSRMIVWGGLGPGGFLADGASYDPATDSWTPLSAAGAPAARSGHVAVWSGSEMIVWGGNSNTGGRYRPATDSWSPTDSLCAPAARAYVPAVWTGSKMVLWGQADGYEYDPAADAWQQVTATAAPVARTGHTGVWTGSRMIIWGGSDGGVLNSGALLAP